MDKTIIGLIMPHVVLFIISLRCLYKTDTIVVNCVKESIVVRAL